MRVLRERAGAEGRRLRRVFAALILLGLAAGGGLWPAPAAASLDSTISAALRQSGVSGSSTGVFVWDLDAARLIYADNASAKLAPASNMKIATSAAALMRWDLEQRFITELLVPDVPVYGGVLFGDVYLRGQGDPSLSTRSYQRDELDFTTASFEAFARQLKKDGVEKIRGRVRGDASWFDKQEAVASWEPSLRSECGPLSALSGNQGLNEGKRVHAPATWAAQLYTQALRKVGIKVTGKPGSGKAPSTTRLARRQYSAPLPRILKHMNKESDNFFAEMLLKGLGKDFYDSGSTAAGTKATRAALAACGVKRGSYTIEDGSGLSYHDRLTAAGIAQVLGVLRQRADFDVFYSSLAIAGEDGTLRERMQGTAADGNAHAKTGTLNVAVCLSGYVTSANGHEVAFAILMNGSHVGWTKATKAQDTIVVALANATLPGARVLTATPNLRQHARSAFEAVRPVGRSLQPCVQP